MARLINSINNKIEVLRDEVTEINNKLHTKFVDTLYLRRCKLVTTISALEKAARELTALEQ